MSHSTSAPPGPSTPKPPAEAQPGGGPAPASAATGDPILCQHCGRTASNGISCEGYCVADSGY